MLKKIRSLAGRLLRPQQSKEEFAGHYLKWRKQRIDAIVEHYKLQFFAGKNLLEVGCGHGDIGAHFQKLGAIVTCSDARPENLAVARNKYPEISTVLADLDRGWPFDDNFDIVIHMGLLYHLKEAEKPIREACAASWNLVLETEVCDSDDPNDILIVDEESRDYDQAFGGKGCRPSPAYVERILHDCGMTFTRIMDARCNAEFHVYDWQVQNTKTWRSGLRAMWFAHRPQ